MYDLARLLADAEKTWGPLRKDAGGGHGGGAEYRQVWDAFNRYVSATMEKRCTLHLSKFCKIGWRLTENTPRRKHKFWPHFQLSDQFLRANGFEIKGLVTLPSRSLAIAEEFNFCKAALRFSTNLTKDDIFLGMRAIVHQMGVVMGRGERMCIDFEVGRLRCSDRSCHFDFTSDLYQMEDSHPPPTAIQAGVYRPSANFAPPSKQELQAAACSTRKRTPTRAFDFEVGGWDDLSEDCAQSESERKNTCETWKADGAEDEVSAARKSPPQIMSARDCVQQKFFDRLVAKISNDASQALVDKDDFNAELVRLRQQELEKAAKKKAVIKDYHKELRDQMCQAEGRKVQSRQHRREQAALHDFPQLANDPTAAQVAREKSCLLKDELAQQIQIKREHREAVKEHDVQLEKLHSACTKRVMAIERLESAVRREEEKADLCESWETERRLQQVKRAIQEHERVPSSKANLSQMMTFSLTAPTGSHLVPARGNLTVGGGLGGGSSANSPIAHGGMNSLLSRSLGATAPSFAAETPLSARVGGGDCGRLKSQCAAPASLAGGCTPRPMTGSVRRVPLGAAASLALVKDRLAASIK